MLRVVECGVGRGELWRLVQREVHLNVTAAVVDPRVAFADVRGQHRGVDELVDRQVGRDRGDHDRGRHRLPGLGAHPAHRSVVDEDFGDLRA